MPLSIAEPVRNRRFLGCRQCRSCRVAGSWHAATCVERQRPIQLRFRRTKRGSRNAQVTLAQTAACAISSFSQCLIGHARPEMSRSHQLDRLQPSKIAPTRRRLHAPRLHENSVNCPKISKIAAMFGHSGPAWPLLGRTDSQSVLRRIRMLTVCAVQFASHGAAAMPGALADAGTANGRIEPPFSMSKTSALAPPLIGKAPGAHPGGLGAQAGEDDDRAIGGQRVRARRDDRRQGMGVGLARQRERSGAKADRQRLGQTRRQTIGRRPADQQDVSNP